MENKQLPPKAIVALVFGILSILFNLCFIPTVAFIVNDVLYGGSFAAASAFLCLWFIIVLVFAIIGIRLSRKGYDAVNKNPELYQGVAILKAARVTSIIGALVGFAALILIWLSIKV